MLSFIVVRAFWRRWLFFSGILRWLWLILANSLRVVGGLLRELDSLDRAIDIWDLGGVVHAIDNGAFLLGYADPLKLLVGCCMDSIFGGWVKVDINKRRETSNSMPIICSIKKVPGKCLFVDD